MQCALSEHLPGLRHILKHWNTETHMTPLPTPHPRSLTQSKMDPLGNSIAEAQFRAMVLKGMTSSLPGGFVKTHCWAHPQSFLLFLSGVGPGNLHF